jgi:hypothetical protein
MSSSFIGDNSFSGSGNYKNIDDIIKENQWKKLIHCEEKKSKELIDQSSWLEKPPLQESPPDIDFRLFALLAGDNYVQGTPLEGHSSEIALKYTADYLTFLSKAQKDYGISQEEKERVDGFQKDMAWCHSIEKEALEISEKMQKSTVEEQSTALYDYAKNLSNKFKSALTNQSAVWFPLSWNNTSSGGHAMLLRIEKGTITIVNTGAGLSQEHQPVYSKEWDEVTGEVKVLEKFQLFTTYDCTHLDRLCSPEFFQLLLEIKMGPIWDSSLQIGEQHIYSGIKNFLGGIARKDPDPIDNPAFYLLPQQSGSCSISSIKAAFYYTMINGFEKNVKSVKNSIKIEKVFYLWERDALISIAKQLKEEIGFAKTNKPLSEETIRLINEIMGNLSARAEKLKIEGELEESDLGQLEATCKDIEQRMTKRRKEEKENLIKESSLDFSVKYPDQDEKYFGSAENYKKPNDLKELHVKDSSNQLPYTNKSLHKLKPLTAWDIYDSNNKPSMKLVSGVLKNWADELWPKQDVDKLDVVTLQRFEELLSMLPIPTNESSSVWNQMEMTREEIESCMHSLDQLMKQLFFCCSNRRHPPAATVAIYGLYSVLHFLAKKDDADGYLNDYTVNYTELLR